MQKRYVPLLFAFFFSLSYGMDNNTFYACKEVEECYSNYLAENSLEDSERESRNYVENNFNLNIVEFDLFVKKILDNKVESIGTYYRAVYCPKGLRDAVWGKVLPYAEGGDISDRLAIGTIKAIANEKTLKEYGVIPEECCTSYASIADYYRVKPYYDAQENYDANEGWEQKKNRRSRGNNNNNG